MNYIIVWRSNHRDPHIDMDSNGFKETYPDYESAKAYAESLEEHGREKRNYHDFEIYQLVEE